MKVTGKLPAKLAAAVVLFRVLRIIIHTIERIGYRGEEIIFLPKVEGKRKNAGNHIFM